jgi:hypothetical protein
MHLLADGLFFGGNDQDFLKEGVKAYLLASILPLKLQTFFLLLRKYSMDRSVR